MDAPYDVPHVRAFLTCPGRELPVSEAMLPTVPVEGTILTLHGDETFTYRISAVRSCSPDVIFLDLEPAPAEDNGPELALRVSSAL